VVEVTAVKTGFPIHVLQSLFHSRTLNKPLLCCTNADHFIVRDATLFVLPNLLTPEIQSSTLPVFIFNLTSSFVRNIYPLPSFHELQYLSQTCFAVRRIFILHGCLGVLLSFLPRTLFTSLCTHIPPSVPHTYFRQVVPMHSSDLAKLGHRLLLVLYLHMQRSRRCRLSHLQDMRRMLSPDHKSTTNNSASIPGTLRSEIKLACMKIGRPGLGRT